MEQQNIVLTDTDKQILESYRNLLYGFADYMGEGYEVVLHSLESMEHSVIAIANGHHTGRKEGSPITDLALKMLPQLTTRGTQGYVSYFSKNKNGRPLKSSTIAIYGEKGRVIGLLCMNFYLDTPLSAFISTLAEQHNVQPAYISETFVDKAEDLVERVLEQVQHEVEQDERVLPSLKNKEIVQRCNAQGIFQIKNAVVTVAEKLGISKNTVYLHLRNKHD